MLLLCLLLVKIQASINTPSCSCSELRLEQECQYAGCEWNYNSYTNTFQCADKSHINQPNCSDYDDQLLCDFLQGCAWNNQGKCEQFTQCSDYVIDQQDTSDQCHLKDQTCKNGQINHQRLITCQSIDQFCIDYTNELMTIDFENQTQIIAEDVQNETTITDLKKNIQNTCIQQQTIINECSMITNEILCKFIKNKYQTIICEWQNDQCIESTNKPQLNSQQCYLQTGGTYSWIDNNCQICQGFNKQRILQTINQPISSTTVKESQKKVYESLTSNPTPTFINKCSTSINLFETNMCFTEGCQKAYAEKLQTICKSFAGANLDQLSQESYHDQVCSYDENSTMISQSTEFNSTLNCQETILYIPYVNGVKQTPFSRNLQKSTNCTKKYVNNQINTRNSVMKCQGLNTVFKNHELEYSDAYSGLKQDQTQPSGNDPLTEETYITIGTRTHYYDSLPKVDITFSSIKYFTPFQSNYSSKNNFIDVGNKMFQTLGQSNSTTEIKINNQTDSFKNTTKNTFSKSYSESSHDNDPATLSKSNSTENITLTQEVTTRIYKSP